MSPTSQGERSQCWGPPDWERIDFISSQHPTPPNCGCLSTQPRKKSIHPLSPARAETSSPTYKRLSQGLERFNRPSRVTRRCSKSQAGKQWPCSFLLGSAASWTSLSYIPWFRPPLSRMDAGPQVILPGQLHRTTWPDLDLDLDIEFCHLVAV